MLNKNEVLVQSKKAYAAWKDLWKYNSSIVKNEITDKLPMSMFKNYGIGKTCLLISMGESLEDDIEYIQKHQRNVDIVCVDKAFGELVKRGIHPDFCLVADAQVSFENYLEPYLEHTKYTTLLANVNSNPLWGLNWKGSKTYYVNKDNINSEKEFSTISGITDIIPAGSNVSNAMTIYATEVLNYDHYLMIGFDFCWKPKGKFYAFSDGTEKVTNKTKLLNQVRLTNAKGDIVFASENLWFSSRWLEGWCKSKGINKFTNCSYGLLPNIECKGLKQMLTDIKTYKRQLTADEHKIVNKRELNIDSVEAYNNAKQLLTEESVNVLGGTLVFQLPQDQAMRYPIHQKGEQPVLPQQELNTQKV